MPLFASRRKATQGSCPWCSLALVAIAGLVLRGELMPDVSAGAQATRFGSALAVDELRMVLGACVAPSPVVLADEPPSSPAVSGVPVSSTQLAPPTHSPLDEASPERRAAADLDASPASRPGPLSSVAE